MRTLSFILRGQRGGRTGLGRSVDLLRASHPPLKGREPPCNKSSPSACLDNIGQLQGKKQRRWKYTEEER